jgi:uncharacterized repeat protein (TIGR01451 family)
MVVISQTLNQLELRMEADDITPVVPYAIDIGYTIKVENIGTVDLAITEFIDLLPVGIEYLENTCYNSPDPFCIADPPFKKHHVQPDTVDRWRITWKFGTPILIAPGASATLDFSAEALAFQGNYWVDLLVSFDGVFPEKIYTWPTAVIAVKEEYSVVEITVNDEVLEIKVLDLVVQAYGGQVLNWNIY